ncbi:MAG: fructose-6-phosphate aldolase [Parvibaculales bacterium]
MKFFIDSADIDDIRELAATGLVDGVTTNPSLVAKAGRDFKDLIAEICSIVDGPVSAEVTALEADAMIAEGETLAAIADNVCIKIPLTLAGLKATRALADKGFQVNVTLCFSANQALLAAKAGAAFISPFVGRLDDIGANGMGLIADIRQIYDNYPDLETEILVASVRSADHIHQSALIGADVATLPPNVLRALVKHPLTDKGLDAFMADWAASGLKL